MSSPFISLRHHTRRAIGLFDYPALKRFEELHPELYVDAKAPPMKSAKQTMKIQMRAFNAVHNSEWKEELNRLVALEEENGEQAWRAVLTAMMGQR